MQIFHSLDALPPNEHRAAVAIGNFDGVHRGHQALLRHMLSSARAEKAISTVLTFHPHPVEVLRPGTKLERLTTTEEKLALLEEQGVKRVLVEPFNVELAALSADAFFERFLVKGLRAASLHVGDDFHFGAKREGNIARLRSLCDKASIKLEVESPSELGGVRISSSLVREAVIQGNVTQAAEYLGRPYTMAGTVIKGDQRGRQLGFPTANLQFPPEKVVPRNGVYLTASTVNGETYRSVTNIGVRPTFGANRPSVETHLLDFDSTIYDETLQLEFWGRLRDEKKFDSVDALKRQITLDVNEARGKK